MKVHTSECLEMFRANRTAIYLYKVVTGKVLYLGYLSHRTNARGLQEGGRA